MSFLPLKEQSCFDDAVEDPNTMSGTFRSLIFHALPKFLGFQVHGYLIEDVRKRAFSPSVSRISQIMNL